MKLGDAHTVRWVRLYAIGAVLLAALIAGWALSSSILASPELLLQDVEVHGLRYLSKEDVLRIADLDQPKSTLKVKNERVLTRLQQHAWIRTVDLERPRRETLRIVIEEATPRVIVATPSLMLADASGIVIDHVVPMYSDLPLLTGATRKIGEREDAAKNPADSHLLALSRSLGGAAIERELEEAIDVAIVRDAVRVLDLWKQLPHARTSPIVELAWDAAQGFTLWLDGAVVIKLGHRDFESALARAHVALQRAKDAKMPLARIDVRAPHRAVLRFDVEELTQHEEGE